MKKGEMNFSLLFGVFALVLAVTIVLLIMSGQGEKLMNLLAGAP